MSNFSNHKLNWSAAAQECTQNYDASLATVENINSSRIINRLDSIRSSTKTAEQLKSKFRSLPSHSTIVIEQCFHQKRESIVVDRNELISIGGLLTSSDCIYECAQARSTLGHECRSVLWRDSERDCLLNRRTQNETELLNTKTIELTDEFAYFEDVCLWPSYRYDEEQQNDFELPHAQPIHNIRNCFNKHKNMILYGYANQIVQDVTERECLLLCYGEDCKTVNYYRYGNYM
ncbi:hypothetical protein M3Y98_00136700 [Aphelenchoides besseyi]|nr:hypothetical protein M3Y98_00136700 [Aphelenchoides besseyi]KAI6199663.1 hypothetical protein M3Y96_00650700 [Aphelenchoides besseyi]